MSAYAVTGTVQIVGTNVPTKLIADRSFQLNVSLKITCTPTHNDLARVDVSPHRDHRLCRTQTSINSIWKSLSPSFLAFHTFLLD